MNLKNQRPVFVPDEHRAEIEKLSKAALMDMVWDYAQQIGAADALAEHGKALTGDYAATMAEFRKRREIILSYRQNTKAA